MTHEIIAHARGWLGTRFHHQGRLRKTATHKGGVDCLGLLVGVADEMHLSSAEGLLLSAADETDYSHQPDIAKLRNALESFLIHIPVAGIQPGDILLLRIDGSPQHLAIVSDYEQGLGIIHAYAPAKAVVEHGLDRWWIERIEAAFRLAPTAGKRFSGLAPA